MRPAPQPRVSNFMGLRETAHINEDGSWLEPESMTYPSGGFHRRAYVKLRPNPHNPIELPYGEKRVVIASIPSSFSYLPARIRFRGKTVKGYISGTSEDPFFFSPEADPDRCLNCQPGEGCKRVSE